MLLRDTLLVLRVFMLCVGLVPSALAQVQTLTISSSGTWSNCQGGNLLQCQTLTETSTTQPCGQDTRLSTSLSSVRWGIAQGGGKQSGLVFRGVRNINYEPGPGQPPFLLGSITHENFRIDEAASIATSVTLTINVQIQGETFSLPISVTIDETANTDKCRSYSGNTCTSCPVAETKYWNDWQAPWSSLLPCCPYYTTPLDNKGGGYCSDRITVNVQSVVEVGDLTLLLQEFVPDTCVVPTSTDLADEVSFISQEQKDNVNYLFATLRISCGDNAACAAQDSVCGFGECDETRGVCEFTSNNNVQTCTLEFEQDEGCTVDQGSCDAQTGACNQPPRSKDSPCSTGTDTSLNAISNYDQNFRINTRCTTWTCAGGSSRKCEYKNKDNGASCNLGGEPTECFNCVCATGGRAVNDKNGQTCGSTTGLAPCRRRLCVNGVCEVALALADTQCTPSGVTLSSCQEGRCTSDGTCQVLPKTGQTCSPTGTTLTSCQEGRCTAQGTCQVANKAADTSCPVINNPSFHTRCRPASAKCDGNGNCIQNFYGADRSCNDNLSVCQSGVCNGAGGCTVSNTPRGSCSQNEACKVKSCVSGSCQVTGNAAGACSLGGGNTCVTGTCSSGTCVAVQVTDSRSCTLADQSNPCVKGQCGGGTCNVVPLADTTSCPYNDDNQCTVGQCQSGTCQPVNVPNGLLCDFTGENNNACLQGECTGGSCALSPKDDGTACTGPIDHSCIAYFCEGGSCVPDLTGDTTDCAPITCFHPVCDEANFGQCKAGQFQNAGSSCPAARDHSCLAYTCDGAGNCVPSITGDHSDCPARTCHSVACSSNPNAAELCVYNPLAVGTFCAGSGTPATCMEFTCDASAECVQTPIAARTLEHSCGLAPEPCKKSVCRANGNIGFCDNTVNNNALENKACRDGRDDFHDFCYFGLCRFDDHSELICETTAINQDIACEPAGFDAPPCLRFACDENGHCASSPRDSSTVCFTLEDEDSPYYPGCSYFTCDGNGVCNNETAVLAPAGTSCGQRTCLQLTCDNGECRVEDLPDGTSCRPFVDYRRRDQYLFQNQLEPQQPLLRADAAAERLPFFLCEDFKCVRGSCGTERDPLANGTECDPYPEEDHCLEGRCILVPDDPNNSTRCELSRVDDCDECSRWDGDCGGCNGQNNATLFRCRYCGGLCWGVEQWDKLLEYAPDTPLNCTVLCGGGNDDNDVPIIVGAVVAATAASLALVVAAAGLIWWKFHKKRPVEDALAAGISLRMAGEQSAIYQGNTVVQTSPLWENTGDD
ncbi:hypothetical protein QOT17_010280 [Balamuthia mandrillaris]